MNKSQRTNQFILIAKSLSIVLGAIALCWLLVAGIFTLLPYISQSDYSYVGTNFAEALMQNNSRLARALSTPSQWERIDDWMSRHEPFKCPFSFDDPNSGSAGGLDDERAHVLYYHICWVDDYYKFVIEDIVLQRQNDRWQVVDWSEVQETKE
jgi:hypothetical protein